MNTMVRSLVAAQNETLFKGRTAMTNGTDINKRANTDPAFRDQLKADPTTPIPVEPAAELEEAKLNEVVGGVYNPQRTKPVEVAIDGIT